MTLIGNWQVANLAEPKRFVLYANAYLDAARGVCLKMCEDSTEHTWPNAAVALMLTAHATELFLKTAILSRGASKFKKLHSIEDLAHTYEQLFPEPELRLDVPFRCQNLDELDEEMLRMLNNEQTPSILYRYPVDSPGVEWRTVSGFEAREFLLMLASLREGFERVGGHI